MVEERLKVLGAGVLYVVSDRAEALIQLAEQGLTCLSMPDFFHIVHEIVKSYSLAIGQRWRHAQQELTQATEALARYQGGSKRSKHLARPERWCKRGKPR